MEVHIAGLVPELKADVGFFSINPISIRNIRKTDLIIVPSLYFDEHLVERFSGDLTIAPEARAT
jgi:hypothetical protein